MKLARVLISNWPFFLILSVATFLRFYHLETLTTFGAEQAYDFLIVKRMVVDHHFTLLGPKFGPYNNLATMYLGPAYYYILAPILLISNFDPVGPAAFTVLLSLGTIVVIYIFVKTYLGKSAAILASILYAMNTFLIDQSRATSEVHWVPFFATVILYSLAKITIDDSKSRLWPILIGTSQGLIFQFHYLTVSLIPAEIFMLAKFKKIKKLFLILVSFLIVVSPQLAFELRHNFFVTKQFLIQITKGGSVSQSSTFREHLTISVDFLTKTFLANKFSALVIPFLFFSYFFYFKNKNKLSTFVFLWVSIFANIFAASLFSGNVGYHYFASIYSFVVILVAASFTYFFNMKNYFVKSLTLIFLLEIIASNLLTLNLNRVEGYTMPQGWNLKGIKKASVIIYQDADPSRKFNIAATLDGDSRARPYRYFVEVMGKVPQDVEKYPDSETLYLVSRDDQDLIKRYTVWEVASFAPFEFEKIWDIQNGIRLYKLKKETI